MQKFIEWVKERFLLRASRIQLVEKKVNYLNRILGINWAPRALEAPLESNIIEEKISLIKNTRKAIH